MYTARLGHPGHQSIDEASDFITNYDIRYRLGQDGAEEAEGE